VQSGGWTLAVWAVLAVVVAPPVEEFVFRGVLLAGLSSRMRAPVAAFVVTLVFALGHVAEAIHYWPAWVGIIGLGIATAWSRLRSGTLLPAVALHASYNGCIVATTFAALP